MPRPPGAVRRVLREHPLSVDAGIAIGYVLLAVGLGVLGAMIPEEPEGAFTFTMPTYLHFPQVLLIVVIAAVTVAALLFRRQYPLSSLLLALAVTILATDDMVFAFANTVAIWVLLYSVPVYRSVAAGWVGYGLTVAISLLPSPMLVQATAADGQPVESFAVLVVVSALLFLIPVMIGINAGNRRRYLDAIIDRANQLARERDQLARLAVAEERSRIAREMHDIIAHSVSVMVTLSEGAARAAQINPGEAAKAMEQSAETGRSALGEMRRLLGVLRESPTDAPAFAPMPGIDALPELIEGFRSADLKVSLILKGESSSSAEREHGQELAVYRVVQEALTNALRYAGPGADVIVTVDQQPSMITVQITDDGGAPGQEKPIGDVGSGQGLVGLSERVRMYGGTLDFGPNEQRGWQVTASLPPTPGDSGPTESDPSEENRGKDLG